MRNVGRPTLAVFLPEPAVAVGTGVVVCPGGAFHFLMVDQGRDRLSRGVSPTGRVAIPSGAAVGAPCLGYDPQ